uniref:Carnitine O-acetyltransferase-like n=1 Tax=Stegastes partitus TaxID=144197 RepID=A0A3B4ZU04_9TELE
MLRICTRTMVNFGVLYPCGLVKSCHLVKSVSASLVTGRYFTHQTGLPRMPVPPLQQTCERYLSLLEPIVEVDELKRTKALVEEFQKAGGVGERLQRCLEIRAQNTDNWNTRYVLHIDYTGNRKPVVVYSNVGTTFPRQDFRDKQGQTRSASIDRACMFCSETLPVEYMGGNPLCMKQYSQLLSSCRIPGPEVDSVVYHAKSSNPPKHMTVVHNSQFFVLEVYNSDGTPLTVDQLYVQLEKICNSSPESDAEPVGLLTTMDRDSWSKAFISLIKDKTNEESLSSIERSICTVCLDGPMPIASDESGVLRVLHGGGSEWNSANRWFDKTLQLIVGEDGTLGCNLSHAAADAIVFMAFLDYIMQSVVEPLPMPQKLHFNITPDINKDIGKAKQNLDVSVMVFNHFGKNVLKAHKMSPDAFIQMAIQLAYYRMYQRCCASYEAASLRTFRDGRVATISTTTSASAAFIKAFDDPKKQNTEKVYLLKEAIKVHRSNTNLAVSGQDVEGHLKVLALQAVEEKISMPDIFTDVSYHKFLDYRLSTSQVPSRAGCLPYAGPATPNLYDMCYYHTSDKIIFVVTACHSCKENNVAQLVQVLEDAMLDMRALLEETREPTEANAY